MNCYPVVSLHSQIYMSDLQWYPYQLDLGKTDGDILVFIGRKATLAYNLCYQNYGLCAVVNRKCIS